MRNLLRLEEGLLFMGSMYLFSLPGLYLGSPLWQAAGVILFAHTAMDRMLGYGLKYEKGFIFTHLGTIGPKREPNA